MLGLSPWEIILILLVVLLIFGAKRLPEMGRSLGSGMREFKRSVTGENDERERERAAAEAIPQATEDKTPAA